MAWNTWMGLSESLSPLKLCASVRIDSHVPQYFHHILRCPSIWNHCFRHKHPSAIIPGCDGQTLTHPMEQSRSQNAKMASSLLYFHLSASAPHISAFLLPDSLSPRNSGVGSSASRHGGGCLIWDECYITHGTGPSLIHQCLLLLSARTADISAPRASWSRCLLDAVRDYLLGKQMIFCLMSK